MFIMIVISPKLKGKNILITHGTLEIGDVPKSALQDRAIPKVIKNIPTANIASRGLKC